MPLAMVADLETIGERLDAAGELAAYGIRRRADSAYFHFLAEPLEVETLPPDPADRVYRLLTLATPDGDVVQATLPRFDRALLGCICDVVVATHLDAYGRDRMHRHVMFLEESAPFAGALAQALAGFA